MDQIAPEGTGYDRYDLKVFHCVLSFQSAFKQSQLLKMNFFLKFNIFFFLYRAGCGFPRTGLENKSCLHLLELTGIF